MNFFHPGYNLSHVLNHLDFDISMTFFFIVDTKGRGDYIVIFELIFFLKNFFLDLWNGSESSSHTKNVLKKRGDFSIRELGDDEVNCESFVHINLGDSSFLVFEDVGKGSFEAITHVLVYGISFFVG